MLSLFLFALLQRRVAFLARRATRNYPGAKEAAAAACFIANLRALAALRLIRAERRIPGSLGTEGTDDGVDNIIPWLNANSFMQPCLRLWVNARERRAKSNHC